MIEIQNLYKSYGSLEVLKDISFKIEKGDIFGIIGQSGAGKSTLLRCFNGLENFQKGEVIVDGQAISSLNKQGEDEGISYRTGIYYTNESDLEIIQNKTNEIQKNYQEKVVVEIQPLDNFYEAEEYHQKYLEKNPQGYCHIGKCFFG